MCDVGSALFKCYRLVRSLQDLGITVDEAGRLRVERTGEYVTMSSIQGDANLLVMAITHYVRFEF